MSIDALKKIELDYTKLEGIHLSQIYSSGYEYAVANGKGEVVTPFMLCKDYFQDMFYGYMHNKSVGIYGFRFHPAKLNISKAHNKLLVRSKKDNSEELLVWIENSIEFVNKYFAEILKSNKIKLLGINKTEDNGDVFVLSLPMAVFLSPPIISLFTLLFRAGGKFEKDKHSVNEYIQLLAGRSPLLSGKWIAQVNDFSYVNRSKDAIIGLFEKGFYTFFDKTKKNNWPEKIGNDVHFLHDNTGIVNYQESGLFNEQTTKSIKYGEAILQRV